MTSVQKTVQSDVDADLLDYLTAKPAPQCAWARALGKMTEQQRATVNEALDRGVHPRVLIARLREKGIPACDHTVTQGHREGRCACRPKLTT